MARSKLGHKAVVTAVGCILAAACSMPGRLALPSADEEATRPVDGLAWLRGNVRLAGGPAPGAKVVAVPDLAPPEGGAYEATADQSGRFELALPPGTYNLVARQPGAGASGVRWRVQTPTTVDVDLTATACLAGSVSSALPTGRVPDRITIFIPGTDFVAVANDSRTYGICGLPAGTYKLVARSAGFGLATATGVEVVTGDSNSAPELILPFDSGKGSVAGRVTLADAGDASEIRIKAVSVAGTPEATASASGAYSLSDLPGTYVRLEISKLHYATASLDIPVFRDQSTLAPDVQLPRDYLPETVPSGATDFFSFTEPVLQDLLASELVWDGNGNILFASAAWNKVYKFVPATGALTDVVASGLKAPEGIALDGIGGIYVADTSNHVIRKYNSQGQIQANIGYSGSAGRQDGIGEGAGHRTCRKQERREWAGDVVFEDVIHLVS